MAYVACSGSSDFDAWISLAREVEPLFGPMADVAAFQTALQNAISLKTAFCIRQGGVFKGGVIISTEDNEIAWLAVFEKYRNNGYGKQLIDFAVSRLDPARPVFVQTFDETVIEGRAARKLYLDYGFADFKKSGQNPAGIPTVMMRLAR